MSVVISEEFRELVGQIFQKWGYNSQVRMMIEECGELIVALAKYGRAENGSNAEQVIEELVDVEIMLGQMKVMYTMNPKSWDNKYRQKILRLKDRLRKTK